MLTFIRTCAALGFALWFVPAGLGRLTLPGQQTALRIAAGGALGLVVFELLTLPFHTAGASFRVMVALWCAWLRALRMISGVTPAILISIWNAVMPSFVPATLKSISPR